jgi:hypothetical protein
MATDEQPPKPSNFTEEGMQNVAAFLATLKRIHIRLTIEEQHKKNADGYPLDKDGEGRDPGLVRIRPNEPIPDLQP